MLLTFKLLITFTLIRNISNLFHQKSLGSRQNSRWIPFCQNAAKSRGIHLNAITHENRYTPRTGDPTITQFRISAHKLRIETGRFNNKLKYVPPEQRLCEYCSMNKIEDEYHYLVECPLYKDNRSKLFSYIIEENKYFPVYNGIQKFIWIMTCENILILNQFGEFLIRNNALRIQTTI